MGEPRHQHDGESAPVGEEAGGEGCGSGTAVTDPS